MAMSLQSGLTYYSAGQYIRHKAAEIARYFKVSFEPARHEVIVGRYNNRSSIIRCLWDRPRTLAAYPCSLSARWAPRPGTRVLLLHPSLGRITAIPSLCPELLEPILVC